MTIQDQTSLLPGEIWKSIPGYEGIYSVSNLGRVKRDKRIKIRKNGSRYPVSEKILSPYKRDTKYTGYYSVNLNQGAKQKSFLVHRLVAIVFISNPYDLPCVNHKNENKLDNRVENLEWCTHSYNNTYNDRAKKIGSKLSGRVPANAKALRCIETGEVYSSIEEAHDKLNLGYRKIRAILSGKSRLDIHFEYIDKQEARKLFKYHR